MCLVITYNTGKAYIYIYIYIYIQLASVPFLTANTGKQSVGISKAPPSDVI